MKFNRSLIIYFLLILVVSCKADSLDNHMSENLLEDFSDDTEMRF